MMTMTPDMINGSIEAVAGGAVLNHCRTLYRHKQVRGVSVASTALFALWGVWNLYYYPHLGQVWSFAGGVFITLANGLYVALLTHYSGPDRIKRAVRDFLGGLVCRVKGHDYPGLVIRSDCLYFCRRCHRELADRSFADLEPMSAEDLEQMHRYMQFAEDRS